MARLASRHCDTRAVTILLNPGDLDVRRRVAAHSLAPLAGSLRIDMERVLREAPAISGEKAMLTRDGGRCPLDGAPLEFDPYSPHAHRCPACHTVQARERDHRWWLMFAQLWRAERAVHAATLHATGNEPILAAFARATLDEYADRYVRYPLDDNVLGPSRPFFSTYLESIWLLQLCIAADLLDAANAGEGATGRFRDRVVEPSAALIRSYDEGESNRQLWNNAALLAAGRALGDHALSRHAVQSSSGLLAQLGTGLLIDGSWFEGENYHLFSHRGLWYGVTMADVAGFEIPSGLRERFEAGFSTPFLTAFPDLGFPARRDSQYGASLRQWRTAESCELGLAHSDDPRLTSALAALYADDIPRRDTGRWRSAAESERNEPPSALGRADLGWRSLLFARETLPVLELVSEPSAVLEGQGIAVFRRDGGQGYIALDYGHHGGGHGHPDRLDLLLAHGERRILDDMGTGSYVDRSLHWYRSTLAHNAPLVNGCSQPRASGQLLAYEEGAGLGWIWARARVSQRPECEVERALTVTEHVCIDEIRWNAGESVRLELPVHARVRAEGATDWSDALLDGGEGLEDGFSFARDARRATARAHEIIRLVDEESGSSVAWVSADSDAEWWTAVAPGAPGRGDARFALLRLHGATGRVRVVWDLALALADVAMDAEQLRITERSGATIAYSWRHDGAHITTRRNGLERAARLAGFRRPARIDPAPPHAPPRPSLAHSLPFARDLGEDAYRMSERGWRDAGSPRAHVSIDANDAALDVRVDVRKSPLCFREADDPDPALDNESPDINSDGVQLHLWRDGWREPAAWLAIPERDFSRTRIRRVAGENSTPTVRATSRETDGGFEIVFTIPRPALGALIALDVLVNDMSAGRQRRRGQLVLSGAHGERVYLRGDRQPLERFLRFRLSS